MNTISERLRAIDEAAMYEAPATTQRVIDEAADTIDALEKALERSKVAIDDWLHTYASELCREEHVKETQVRIMAEGGTLAYIADVQQQNRAALSRVKGEG